MTQWCLRALAALSLLCAGIVVSRAEAPAPPAPPALPRIVAVAAADGEALTLGHVVSVTLCNPKDAKAALDATKLGLLLGGFRAADRPSTVVPKTVECDLANGLKGAPVEIRFRAEYTHGKRKDWLTVFDSREDYKVAVGLADESGKPLGIESASDARTVLLKRMLQWELWVCVGIGVLLVLGLAALVLWSNLLRDGGDNLAVSWKKYLGGKFEAWQSATFSVGPSQNELRQVLEAAGATPAQAQATIAAANGKTPADFDALVDPYVTSIKAPYSLARLQMAVWTIVILFGLWLVYLITATIFQIPGSVLVLIGVAGATYLGSRVLDARASAAPANPPAAAPAHAPPRSRDLLTDIVSDERGIALHRAQMAIWTFALVAMFLAELFRRLVFVEFDDTMLGLLGISNGTYLALKALEK